MISELFVNIGSVCGKKYSKADDMQCLFKFIDYH